MTTLRNARHPYVFIPKPAGCDVDAADVYAELHDTPPMWVGEGGDGFYAAFKVLADATRCKFAHETLSIGGYILQVDARPAPIVVPKDAISPGTKSTAAAPAVQPHKKLDTGLRPLTAEGEQKTEWTATELQEAVYRMLQQHLADGFIRDVKNRVVSKHVEAYLRPGGEGRDILVKAMNTVPVVPLPAHERASSSLTAAGGEDRLPSFRRKTADAKPKKQADESASKARRDSKESTKSREAAGKVKSRRVKEVSSSDDEIEDISRDAKISARRDSRSKKRHGAASLLHATDDEEDDMDDGASTQPDAASTPAKVDLDEELSTKGKKHSKAKATAATKKKGATTARKGAKAEVTPSEADGETEQGSETATPETELPVKAVKAKTKAMKASAKSKADPRRSVRGWACRGCRGLRLLAPCSRASARDRRAAQRTHTA